MRRIGIGIIGSGDRMRGVLAQLLRTTPDVDVVAVMDPSAESVAATLREFNPAARVYADYRALVQDPRVEWVCIGSWNSAHAAQILAAFAAGKHVFCEKPLATSLEDCRAVRQAWLASGLSFVIGFTLRYSAHYQRIAQLVQDGAIGDLISMEFNEILDWNHGGYIHANWRRFTANAGSHVLEKCCHDIDLVNWIVGSRARRVASFGGCSFFTPRYAGMMERVGRNAEGKQGFLTWYPGEAENPFTTEKDIVDHQVTILEYANGVRATFHTNCASAIPERRMYLCGTEGTIRADVISGSIELQRIGFDTVREDVSSGVSGGHGGGDPILCRELARVMFDGGSPHATLEDGLTAALTCFAIDEALESGQVVDVQPWWDAIA